MATLTGNPINTSYPGLLKTSDNAILPTGGATVIVTDGDGNTTGLRLGQDYLAIEPTAGYMYDVGAENGFYYDNTSVRPQGNWDFTSATVNNLNIGVESVVAGTNVTVDNTDPANPIVSAAGGGGGGLENYMYYPWSANTQGYGSTYARYTQPIMGSAFWNSAIDQNANTGILSQMYAQPGLEINVFVNAFLSVVANDTYELAIYDTWGDGSPKDKVFTTSVSVIGASGDQYVETAVSWIPTGNRYWYGLQSASGTNSKMGMFSRDQVSSMYASYGGYGASPVGMNNVNSLYYGGGAFPATLALGQSYGHRDEPLVALYKTV